MPLWGRLCQSPVESHRSRHIHGKQLLFDWTARWQNLIASISQDSRYHCGRRTGIKLSFRWMFSFKFWSNQSWSNSCLLRTSGVLSPGVVSFAIITAPCTSASTRRPSLFLPHHMHRASLTTDPTILSKLWVRGGVWGRGWGLVSPLIPFWSLFLSFPTPHSMTIQASLKTPPSGRIWSFKLLRWGRI